MPLLIIPVYFSRKLMSLRPYKRSTKRFLFTLCRLIFLKRLINVGRRSVLLKRAIKVSYFDSLFFDLPNFVSDRVFYLYNVLLMIYRE